ncbi:hypothetical protein [Caudoviricetes sp.]|nr:hypothetical protein [Caudoviricetes sp.]
MVYFLHASDWIHALDAICSVCTFKRIGGMMRALTSTISNNQN